MAGGRHERVARRTGQTERVGEQVDRPALGPHDPATLKFSYGPHAEAGPLRELLLGQAGHLAVPMQSRGESDPKKLGVMIRIRKHDQRGYLSVSVEDTLASHTRSITAVAGYRPSVRAMIMRCTSDVPSPISSTLASRHIRATGVSFMKPYPPWICVASRALATAASLAWSFAIEAWR